MQQNSQTFSFPDDPIRYLSPSWHDLTQYCLDLSITISATHIDHVISMAKGGWALSRLFADCASVRELYSLGIKFYTGIGEQASHPVLYQDIAQQVVEDKHLLLFDDVADSGHSLHFAREHLLKLGAQSVHTVAIFYKPQSLVKPDYYCIETTDWVIFPFEVFETCAQLTCRWDKLGIAKSLQDEQLRTLGFQSHLIEHYRTIIDKRM